MRIQRPLQLDRRQYLRFGLRVIDARQHQLPDLFEFRFRKRRLTDNLGDEPQDGRQVLAHGVDRRGERRDAAADIHARLQAIELVLDLLAALLCRAAHQRLHRQARRRLTAVQTAQRAVVKPDRRADGIAARLLRQQGELHA